MQKIAIGIIIGIAVGILLGASIVAPRLSNQSQSKLDVQTSGIVIPPPEETEILLPEPVNPEPIPTLQNGDGLQWKMVSAFDSSMPLFGTLATRLVNKIKLLSNGEITILHHEPDTLAPVNELFQAVYSGSIDAAFTTPSMDIERNNALGLFGATPFGPGPEELLAWFYVGNGRKSFENIYHALGMHAEVCGLIPGEPAGWFQQEITSPTDFGGLRMRIEGLAAKTVEKLGTIPVQLDATEIHTALMNGEINAAEFSLPSLDYKLQLHKAAQHYYFPGWHQRATFLTLLMRFDTWKSLNQQQRSQISSVCGDNIRQGLAEGEAAQYDALKAFSAHGTEIIQFPPDVLDALNDAWQEVVIDESSKNNQFRLIWRSLSLFRRDYDIWNELNDM